MQKGSEIRENTISRTRDNLHDSRFDAVEIDVLAARVAENKSRLLERMERAAAGSGRSVESVSLMGVTKRMSPEAVIAASRAGILHVGENYVQEARDKKSMIDSYHLTSSPDSPEAAINHLQWHLIGHLQGNKAKYCPNLFHVVETIDSLETAQGLNRVLQRNIGETMRVLVEVNLARDPSRPGVAFEKALDLCSQIHSLEYLRLEGFMGVAPPGEPETVARPVFRELKSLWDKLPAVNQKILSMGMSGDFEAAIEEGSTEIRIGTALFGERK